MGEARGPVAPLPNVIVRQLSAAYSALGHGPGSGASRRGGAAPAGVIRASARHKRPDPADGGGVVLRWYSDSKRTAECIGGPFLSACIVVLYRVGTAGFEPATP